MPDKPVIDVKNPKPDAMPNYHLYVKARLDHGVLMREDIAMLLKRSVAWVNEMVVSGRLKCTRYSKQLWLFTWDDLHDFIHDERASAEKDEEDG